MTAAPEVRPHGQYLRAVSGTFYRAVDPRHLGTALAGSRQPGRYSPPGAPALYLSSSPEGVQTAMIAHGDARTPELNIIEVRVHAERVLDLRDEASCRAAGVRVDDAIAPWQQAAAEGGDPPPWSVRRHLEALGSYGVIDPSRRRPGLWHLALFRWNEAGTPQARVQG
ncbi:RES domain-containing protein [Nesterenkonia natronophila]|uniref:RES domain-containing protein n=1 Tax=Nesterenkonia natronophila TaxID=2174932 RepID=A0A3A4F347_9MICC|nr:RES domain-containing protein [Nesterenkonia natronophila]RJN32742.1 RES domain-containing protein [Nesterenkonia natronophila]